MRIEDQLPRDQEGCSDSQGPGVAGRAPACANMARLFLELVPLVWFERKTKRIGGP